jgi:hypothetical protein
MFSYRNRFLICNIVLIRLEMLMVFLNQAFANLLDFRFLEFFYKVSIYGRSLPHKSRYFNVNEIIKIPHY